MTALPPKISWAATITLVQVRKYQNTCMPQQTLLNLDFVPASLCMASRAALCKADACKQMHANVPRIRSISCIHSNTAWATPIALKHVMHCVNMTLQQKHVCCRGSASIQLRRTYHSSLVAPADGNNLQHSVSSGRSALDLNCHYAEEEDLDDGSCCKPYPTRNSLHRSCLRLRRGLSSSLSNNCCGPWWWGNKGGGCLL